ncbi:MAG: M48 family metalloprotease [Leptolyngbyaceae cyanobacterium]
MHQQFKTLALLALLSGLLVALGYFIIGGPTGIFIGLALAAVSNLSSWYFSDKIALSAYKAQPVSREQAPSLYASVARLSQKANIPMPKVYVIPTQSANAFATGRNPDHAAVAVTQGIVNLLSLYSLSMRFRDRGCLTYLRPTLLLKLGLSD